MICVEEFIIKAGLILMLFFWAWMVRCAIYDRKRRISLIKPGSLFISNNERNPFKDHPEYIVLQVESGYVLFQNTKTEVKYTTDVDAFITFYHLKGKD